MLTTELRDRLNRDSNPRLVILVVVVVAGGFAFLCSAGMLRAGVASMGPRYFGAALAGYLAFALLIRVWIAIRRGRFEPDVDFGLDPAGGLHGHAEDVVAAPEITTFSGGGSGGGGGGAGWDPTAADVSTSIARQVPAGTPPSSGGFPLDLDLEELALVALAALLAVGGLAAILYVVYTAPLLLAEVALDAALVSSVYRRLRRRDAGHWGVAVLRRTWVPATMMILFVTAAGFMLQHVFPDARSLGDVVRAGLGGR